MTSEIPRRAEDWPTAASGNQERMFNASVNHGGHPQIFSAWTIAGPLDFTRLRSAWASVLRRHPVLLAPLVRRDGVLLALAPREAGEQARMRVERTGAARDPAGARSWLAAEVADYQARSLASPGREAPRLSMATDGAERHCLVLAVDHLISDGRSMAVLAKDLSRAYRSEAPQAPGPLDYYDWARWDKRRRLSAAYRESLDGWRAVLPAPDDMGSPLLAREAGPGSAVAPARLRRDVGSSAEIQDRARSVAATPFTLALDALSSAAYGLLGTELRTVITSLHNRTQVGTLSLVGYFAHNALIALPGLHGRQPEERLRALGDSVIWSAGHSIVSHRELRRDLWPDISDEKRYDSGKEIFFTFNPSQVDSLSFPGTVVISRTDWLEDSAGHYDFYVNGLSFWLEDESDRVRALVLYRPDLIDESIVSALADGLAARLGARSHPRKYETARDRGELRGQHVD